MNNLENLTNQIYQEGIEKAESQAKVILQDAEKQRDKVLNDAKEEAQKILGEAKKESENIKRSVENELKLKGRQFISDLQHEIIELLAIKIVDQGVAQAFHDEKFYQQLIKDVVGHWNESEELEIILPEKLENRLGENFEQGIRSSLPNLTLNFNGKFEGGFRIAKKNDGFMLSYSDEDFKALFRSYLTQKASEILFNQPE